MSSSSSDEHEKDSEEIFENLPQKSKEKYVREYENFMKWTKSNNILELSEDIFLIYFKEMAEKYKPSTLWCMYSMIKHSLISKNIHDITNYTKLLSYLRELSSGFTSVQSKVLTEEQINKFLKEAPDEIYLVTKVALIFGVSAGCTAQQLRNLTSRDIKDYGELMHVKISNVPQTSRNPARPFVVDGFNYEIVKKYHVSRIKAENGDYYFQNYQNGKCTGQPIGKNKFAAMPRQIAEYLELPDPRAYSGNSFKRTSAALHDTTTTVPVKRHRKTYSKPAESESSNQDQTSEVKIDTQSKEDPVNSVKSKIKIEISDNEHNDDPENNYESTPSPTTSLDKPLSAHIKNERSRNKQKPATTFEYEVNGESDDISAAVNSILKVPSKRITLHFHNCTFNNSFNQ